jgi:isopentenyldiphosphate isomerase
MTDEDPVVVVDDTDEIIDYVPRNIADDQGLRYRITGIWIENSKGEVLIAQRGLTKRNSPGLWGPAAAGSVEKDQSYLENAIQEIEEELGIKLDPKDLLQMEHRPTENKGRKRYMTTFRAVVDLPINEIKFGYPEVNAVKWIDKEELFNDIKQHPEKYIVIAQTWESQHSA